MEPHQAKKNNVKQSTLGAFSYVIGTAHVLKSDVGRYCSIATGAAVGPTEHPTDRLSTHSLVYNSPRFLDNPVFAAMKAKGAPHPRNRMRTTIGHDVWIGANASVLCGVTIGTGAIVGAGAVVTKNVPPYAIVVGVPAKVIEYRFAPDLIERLLLSEWWEYHLDQSVVGVDYSEVEAFLDRLETLKKAGALRKLTDVLAESDVSTTQRRPFFRHSLKTYWNQAAIVAAAIAAAAAVIVWQMELV